jgi:glycosyltransferase involved in cell wall biosynthesis
LRIFYITMRFPAASETFACSDIEEVARNGHDVSVYCLRTIVSDFKTLVKERKLEKIPIDSLEIGNFFSGLKLSLFHPFMLFSLILWCLKNSWPKPAHIIKSIALIPRSLYIFFKIRKYKPDVVHLFWGHYPSIVGYLVWRFQPEICLSIFLGAYDLIANYKGSWDLARKSDLVWTHSYYNLTLLKDMGVPIKKVNVVHRGIDLQAIYEKPVEKDPFKIISAGRLVPGKEFDFLLRVFSCLIKKWPEASLVILGDGPERRNLEKLSASLGIQRRVTFLGHVKHEEVFKEMLKGQWFLFFSSNPSERLPNVVKEAMACGCICITNSTPGIEELIMDGINGFIVEKKIEAILNKISVTYNNLDMASNIARNAKKTIELSFNRKNQMKRYTEKWHECVFDRRNQT